MWPECNFRELKLLSRNARTQLAGIYEAVRSFNTVTPRRSAFLALLVSHSYEPGPGTYLPFAPTAKLYRGLPTYSKDVTGSLSPLPYFWNGLIIPKGYNTYGFDAAAAPAPSLRRTNIGFLVATVE